MSTRMRVWHPDYPPSWLERALDLFHGFVPDPLPSGVDTTFLSQQEQRIVRAFLDELVGVSPIGQEMVRADSRWRLPESVEGRRAAATALTLRLRFGQVHNDELRLPMATRWFEFHDTPEGTRVLMRMVDAPSPHLRSFLAANLGRDPRGPWTEVAVGS